MTIRWAPWPLSRGRVLARFAVTALLTILTLALYIGIGRFIVEGPEQLPNGNFSAGLDGWTRLGEINLAAPGVVRIVNDQPAKSAGIQRLLPGSDATTYLNLSGEVRVDGVLGGPIEYQRARLILFSREPDATPRFSLPHEAVRTQGTHDWTRYERTFRVPPTTVIVVSAQMVQATGVMEVRNLRVTPARIRPGFDAAHYALMAAWVVAVAWILWPLFTAVRRDATLLVVFAVLAAIGGATLMNQDARIVLRRLVDTYVPALHAAEPPPIPVARPAAGPAPDAVHAAGAAVSALFAEGPNMLWQRVDKTGHFSAYVVLAFIVLALSRRRWPGMVPLVPIVAVFGLAALTEVWQFMSEDRGPSFSDVGTNSAGVATGLVLCWLVVRLWGLRPGQAKA